MTKIVLVRPIPLYEGQKVGATIQGYEKLGFTKAPGTFDKKRLYSRNGVLDTGMLYKVPNPEYKEIPNPEYKEGTKTPKMIPVDPKIPK